MSKTETGRALSRAAIDHFCRSFQIAPAALICLPETAGTTGQAPRWDHGAAYAEIKFRYKLGVIPYFAVYRFPDESAPKTISFFLLPAVEPQLAQTLAAKFGGATFLLKTPGEKLKEICARPFGPYRAGDTVRVLPLSFRAFSRARSVRRIFMHRFETPSGQVLYDAESVYEILPPRPSYFQTQARYERLI